MAKRRTRKEKSTAHHEFTVSWEPQTSVKSQKSLGSQTPGSLPRPAKKSVPMGMSLDLASIKMDLIKSVSIATLIILFELVIYFFSDHTFF